MISYTVYKFIHFAGLFMTLISLGAIASHRLQGGSKQNFKNRKFFSAFHGLGLVMALVAGFGLMARAQYSFGSGWVWFKVLAWLIVGAYPVIFYKQNQDSKIPYFGLLGVLFMAIYFVEFKPF